MSRLRAGYDVRDEKLPGSSLINAIFNRRLMSWSDRGGASMLLGDAWADRCRAYLAQIIGQDLHAPDGRSYRLRSVLRLDDNPAVEREANLNQLENPDFLLIGEDERNLPIIQAADAKFAADRIKASQVSADAVQSLIEIPKSGATRALLAATLNGFEPGDAEIVPGVFLSPDSPFTDALIERAGRGRRESLPTDLLVRVPVDPGALFAGSPPAQVLPTVARLDHLPVSPRENLLAAVYYLRVACACFHLWDEQTRPLFDAPGEPTGPESGIVAAEVARRTQAASSAYGLLVAWHRDLQKVIRARKTVSDAISLPVGVDEIRSLAGGDNGTATSADIRRVRGALERSYRQHLLALTGPIYADDPRPLKQIVNDIRTRSRELRPTLLDELSKIAGSS